MISVSWFGLYQSKNQYGYSRLTEGNTPDHLAHAFNNIHLLNSSDMDGTLTIPVIDFVEMKRRTGVPPGQDILDTINGWSDTERKEKAFAAILELEEEVKVSASQPC
jgi:hypothetical protein